MANTPCVRTGSQWVDVDSNHCYCCHYQTACHEIEAEALYWEERGRLYPNGNPGSSWWMSFQVTYSAFCNQWPAIGWAMILGKE